MSDISRALSPLPQQFNVVEFTVATVVGVLNLPLIAANPLRWALLIGVPINISTGAPLASWVSPNTNTAEHPSGLPLNANNPVLILNFRDHGTLAQSAWYGGTANSTGVEEWEIIEVLIQQ